MKKIIVFALIGFMAIACKKSTDNGGGGSEPNPMVGNWILDEVEFQGTTVIAGAPIAISGEGENMVGGYNLNADGTMDYDFSCDLVVQTPPTSFPFSSSGSGTWEKNGDILELTNANGGVQAYDIKAVTSSVLIIEQDTVFGQGGLSLDMDLEITLKK